VGLLDQDEKYGLKRILGVVSIPEDAATDAKDHLGVSTHQGFESCFITLVDEQAQELPVRGLVPGEDNPTKMRHDFIGHVFRHGNSFPLNGSTCYSRFLGRMVQNFSRWAKKSSE
jgi:hypothetical protein